MPNNLFAYIVWLLYIFDHQTYFISSPSLFYFFAKHVTFLHRTFCFSLLNMLYFFTELFVFLHSTCCISSPNFLYFFSPKFHHFHFPGIRNWRQLRQVHGNYKFPFLSAQNLFIAI